MYYLLVFLPNKKLKLAKTWFTGALSLVVIEKRVYVVVINKRKGCVFFSIVKDVL